MLSRIVTMCWTLCLLGCGADGMTTPDAEPSQADASDTDTNPATDVNIDRVGRLFPSHALRSFLLPAASVTRDGRLAKPLIDHRGTAMGSSTNPEQLDKLTLR